MAAPARVSKPLLGDLEGIYSARRGTYRVRYRIDHTRDEVGSRCFSRPFVNAVIPDALPATGPC